MPGGGQEIFYTSVRKFLEGAGEDAVNTFKEEVKLSPGDCLRVEFWRKSVAAAADHHTLLLLFREYCKDGMKQLKDVRTSDEIDLKLNCSHEDAKKYAEELQLRMEADLQFEFSNWKGNAINDSEPRGKPNKICPIQ